jgi:hypothetical protein
MFIVRYKVRTLNQDQKKSIPNVMESTCGNKSTVKKHEEKVEVEY